MLLDARHEGTVALDERAKLLGVVGPARAHDGERDEVAVGDGVRDARRRKRRDILGDDSRRDHLEGTLQQRRENGLFDEPEPPPRPEAGGGITARRGVFGACVELTAPPIFGARKGDLELTAPPIFGARKGDLEHRFLDFARAEGRRRNQWWGLRWRRCCRQWRRRRRWRWRRRGGWGRSRWWRWILRRIAGEHWRVQRRWLAWRNQGRWRW